MPDFNIVVRSFLCPPDDWDKVLSTPVDRLPTLTSEERASAKRWGLSEEDERRNALYEALRDERRRTYEAQGLTLGRAVQAILELLDASGRYKVWAVVIEAAEDRWLVGIETPQRVLELSLEASLREKVLRDGGSEAQAALKQAVLQAVGRSDLLAAR